MSNGFVLLFDLNANREVFSPLTVFYYAVSFSNKPDARRFVSGMRIDGHNFYGSSRRHSKLITVGAWLRR